MNKEIEQREKEKRLWMNGTIMTDILRALYSVHKDNTFSMFTH